MAVPLDVKRTTALLERDEARRLTVYDDATGKPLKPGMTLEGWPTIGVGRNLADPGLTDDDVDRMLRFDIATRYAELLGAHPWISALDQPRTAVLVSMAFMGVAKLLRFTKMFTCLRAGDWDGAAREMLRSKWARDVGARAVRLAEQMTLGTWPEALR